MHSEARTTWSNSFERPTLSSRLRFFSSGPGIVRWQQTNCEKQKIVSSKLPLCLMARKDLRISGFEVQIKNGSEMQNQVTNQSKSNS